MDITKLDYRPEARPLKFVGCIVEDMEGTEIISEMSCGFDSYIKQILAEDENYVYHAVYRVGYVVFVYFYKKERSLRDIVLNCKDYTICRTHYETGAVEHAGMMNANLEEFTSEYGPLEDTMYKEEISTEYAKQMAEKLVK